MTYVIRNTFPNDQLLSIKGLKISFCMYMSPNVSEREKDRITFKNLIKSLHVEFESLETSDSKDILIKKLEELELELSWFDHSGKSIIIYIDEVETSLYILHSVEQTFSIVSQTFHIIPLILYYQNLKTYLILALEADDFKILKGNRYEMKCIELLEKTSLKDIFSDSEHQNYVTHGSYGGTKEETVFHGHGSTKDLKDITKMKYFKYVDEYILKHFSKEQNYLIILISNDMNYHDFMSISKNNAVMDQYIEGSIKTITQDEISSKIKSIEEDVYKTFVDSRIKRYHDVFESKQSSDDIEIIRKALKDGKVETLIIDKDFALSEFSNADSKRYEYKYINKSLGDDSINTLILVALSKGSEIIIIDKLITSLDTKIIAIFRYI
jgi:hypothetical protein